LTQASWFRAEDKEVVKAAAEELKFSVIELQTDADRALAAGAHEGVLKGSGGRLIVGSVSAEVYRRIEEHVRKGAGASDPSKPEIASATTTKTLSEQSTNVGAAAAITAGPSRATPAAPAIDKPDSTTAREILRVGARVLAAYWNEKREFDGFLARHRQEDRARRVHARVVRRSGSSSGRWHDIPELSRAFLPKSLLMLPPRPLSETPSSRSLGESWNTRRVTQAAGRSLGREKSARI
jgi:hypothetical protein